MSDLGNREVFSRNLNYYMNLYDKTRREVAADLNISYTTFTSWLNGTNYPRIDKIERLANYFHINKADLIEDKYKDTDSTKASKFMFEKAKVECIRLKPRAEKIEISFKTQD